MKTSGDLRRVPQALPLEPEGPECFRGQAPSCSTGRRIIAHASTIPRSRSTKHAILFMRGAGPFGYPGAAEVVNMRPPNYLIKKGVRSLPCVGDGRQSGTSGSPSILNASPEAAAGGGLAILQDGRPRPLRPQQARSRHPPSPTRSSTSGVRSLKAAGGYHVSRETRRRGRRSAWPIDELATGMVLKARSNFKRIAKTKGIPRDNH